MEKNSNSDNSYKILELLFLQCLKKDSKNAIKKFNYIKYLLEGIGIIESIDKDSIFSYTNMLYDKPITLPRYYNEYQEIEILGKGGFGTVFKSMYYLDQKYYAIKKILVSPNKIKNLNNIISEIAILSRLEHPNIVRYYTSWAEPFILINEKNNETILKNNNVALIEDYNSYTSSGESNDNLSLTNNQLNLLEKKKPDLKIMFYIQTELCSKDNLKDFLDKRKIISIKENTKIIKQIVNSIKYLHNLNIVHNDLKPTNILFSENKKIKITDFGLSKFSYQNIISKEYEGTYLYKDPHTLTINKSSDIYSLGIIIYELFNNFNTEMERYIQLTKLKENNLDQIFVNKYPKISQIIKKCINPVLEKRLTIENLNKIDKNLLTFS